MFLWLMAAVLVVVTIVISLLIAWWVKVAFRNKLARKLLFGFLAVLIALTMTAGFLYARFQSPQRVAERSRAIPVSGNIKFLHGHESIGLDSSEIWMHVSISPVDLDTILSSGSYELLAGQNLNYKAYKPPRWWQIDQLGEIPVFYSCSSGPVRGYDKSATEIIVNRQHTEALVLVRYWYNY
jgi:hypothetical protein